MEAEDLTALYLSIYLASITTVILLLIGTPLAWWLNFSRFRIKIIIEAIATLPLILPPTVLGFFLLILLGGNSPIANIWYKLTNQTLIFNFSGLIIGSVIYSLPFVVQPLQTAFANLNLEFCQMAATLGANYIDQFFNIIVPLCKRGFLSAIILVFAHTIGEFGVVLMIGGNIPGKTRLISIAIYDNVEVLQYRQAFIISLLLLIFSFIALVIMYYLNYSTNSEKK